VGYKLVEKIMMRIHYGQDLLSLAKKTEAKLLFTKMPVNCFGSI